MFYKVLEVPEPPHGYHSSDRLAIGVSLMELKRLNDGMRHCCIAIETFPIKNRVMPLYIAGLECQKFELYQSAAGFFGRAYTLILDLKLMKHNSLLRECKKRCTICHRLSQTEKADWEVVSSSTKKFIITEEIDKYVKNGGTMNDKIYLTRFSDTLRTNVDVKKILETWILNGDLSSQNVLVDPLDLLFKTILSFSPREAFEPVTQVENVLQLYMAVELSKYPEIDDGVDVKSIAKMLEKINHYSSSKFIKLCSIMVKIQTVKSFLAFMKSDYKKSFEGFKWLIKLIEECDKRTPQPVSFTSLKTKIAIYNYCGQACSKLVLGQQVRDEMNGLICSMIIDSDGTEPCCRTNQHFFFTLSLLFEKLAIVNGTIVDIENYNANGLRLSKVHIEEMIRKEILAAILKDEDDVTVIFSYDRILWGLIMYGGVHLKTIWFFMLLRLFYVSKFARFPIPLVKNFNDLRIDINITIESFSGCFTESKKLETTMPDDETDTQSLTMIVTNILRMQEKLSKKDSQDMWNEKHGNLFLAPQAFLKLGKNSPKVGKNKGHGNEAGNGADDNTSNNKNDLKNSEADWNKLLPYDVENAVEKIILLDEFYDETNPYGTNKTFVISKAAQRATRKLRGHIKLHEKIIKFQLKKSREWVVLWLDCYKDLRSPTLQPQISKLLACCLG